MKVSRLLVLILLLSILPNIHCIGFMIMPSSNSRSSNSISSDEAGEERKTSTSTLAPSDSSSTTLPSPFKPPQLDGNILTELQMALIEKIIALEKYGCNNVCGSDFPSTTMRMNEYMMCESCQCDADCFLYDNCCPDVYLLRNITYKNEAECTRLSPTNVILAGRDDTDYNVGIYSSLITKCPVNGVISNDTSEIVQRMKCEQPDVSNLDESLTVSDISTNLSYKNVYCARCHNVRPVDIHEWSIEVGCQTPGKLVKSMPRSKAELYQTLSSRAGVEHTRCQMTYYSDDDNTYRRPCRQPFEFRGPRCGDGYRTSPFYSEEIEKACHMYTSRFSFYYENVFCYMCSLYSRNWTSNSILDIVRYGMIVIGVNMARLNFNALVDFTDDHGAYALRSFSNLPVKCSPSQFYDNATCSCRDIQCDEWRTFEPESRTCPGGIGGLGVGFQACLRVYVDFDTPPALTTIQRLSREFDSIEPTHNLIVTVSEWCPINKRIVIHLESSSTEEDVKDTAYAHDYYEKTFKKDGDIFCNFLEKELEMRSDIMYNGDTIAACAFDMVDAIECPVFNDFSFPCSHSDVGPVRQTEAINESALRQEMQGSFTFMNPVKLNVADLDSFGAPVLNIFEQFKTEIVFSSYVRTDHCSFVDISTSDFIATESALRHRLSSRDMTRVSVQFQQNNTFARVCLSDYLQWSEIDTPTCGNNTDIAFDTWTVAGLISLISSCISLFFLFLTFLTYLLFDELRTKGCVNLMVLTVILFVAQAMYEFGMEQYENKILCSIFGILIHYFWLASIFSMNACTIERFVKLYFPLESRSLFFTKKPLVVATTYTFLCPLLIISCNILANFELTNKIGYGSRQICYINVSYSRIFSFILPMCVILVVNVVLLIITIIKLRKQTLPGDKKKTSSGSRIGLVACVRLSVVTGGTWLISLLYEAIPVEALGYVFTALLGFQGVVFFFSLLGNGRILGLYRGLLTSKKNEANGNRKQQWKKTNDEQYK